MTTPQKTPPILLSLSLLIPLAAACGGADAGLETAGGADAQALMSYGPRNPGGGCDAEFRSCYDSEDSPGGIGGGGGGGGGGGAGEVQCGMDGEWWVPGTGCHPESRCFQDLDNFDNAVRIQWRRQWCQEKGGVGGEYPTESGEVGGYVCSIDGVEEAMSLPTTQACMKLLNPVATTEGEGLMGEPTRTEPPPSGDATVTTTGGGPPEGEEDPESREERVRRRLGLDDPERP